MTKVISLSLLTLLLCLTAFGQKATDQKPTCTLGINQAPELRGFRMGMPLAAVTSRLPGVTVEKPDNFGLARLRLTIIDASALLKSSAKDKGVQPDTLAGPNGNAYVIDAARFPTLQGVRKMQMRFIDGRLSYLEVTYDNVIKWNSIEDFVETVSSTLKLPREWKTPAESDSGQDKELRCEGFVITATTNADPGDVHAGPELILQDPAAWDVMSKRQYEVVEKAKREEDQKRKTFKP